MVPKALALSAQQQAQEAYTVLGMRGVCSADFIVPCTGKYPDVTIEKDAIPVFLEMNAIPGMTGTSLTPMAARVVGLSFEDLRNKFFRQQPQNEPNPTRKKSFVFHFFYYT